MHAEDTITFHVKSVREWNESYRLRESGAIREETSKRANIDFYRILICHDKRYQTHGDIGVRCHGAEMTVGRN